MLIKVCGMRDAGNIRAVEALEVDMIGHVFYPPSPRYVGMRPSCSGIQPDYSEETLRALAGETATERRASRVGVFVDEMPQRIVTRVYSYHLDCIQLHGHETPTLCRNLRRTISPDIRPNIRIIKAISVACAEDIDRWRQYRGAVDMLLFDTPTPSAGGSGRGWDWSLLARYDGDIPFLLSGGIGPGDAQRVRAFCHPQCVGIDLNSRFETEPGVKDVEKLAAFMAELKS